MVSHANEPNRNERLKLAVVTGDHNARDPTKLNAAYGPEDIRSHETMVRAIASLGRFDLMVFNDHQRLFERIVEFAPDLVVNFCDTGLGNLPTRELHIPATLEIAGIPYTGASPQAMVLCFDKQIVRLVAGALGVAIPQEHFLRADKGRRHLPDLYPALLKPNAADGSVGITANAVVRSRDEALTYLAFLDREVPGSDILWQEYLPGPEYGLGLIGNPHQYLVVLPALEVDFSALPAGLDPILSFESKVDPKSPYWTDIKFRPARLDDASRAMLESWARSLFERFGLRDYGRFDFRCAADGVPRLLEINPNPAWAYDGKLAFMAGFAGIGYPRMLEMVIDAAFARIGLAAG